MSCCVTHANYIIITIQLFVIYSSGVQLFTHFHLSYSIIHSLPFIRPFIHSFIHSSIHSFIHLFSFLVLSFTHSFFHWFIAFISLTHSFIISSYILSFHYFIHFLIPFFQYFQHSYLYSFILQANVFNRRIWGIRYLYGWRNLLSKIDPTHCRPLSCVLCLCWPGGAGGRRRPRQGRGQHTGRLRTPPVHRRLSGPVADAQTALCPWVAVGQVVDREKGRTGLGHPYWISLWPTAATNFVKSLGSLKCLLVLHRILVDQITNLTLGVLTEYMAC